MEADADRLRELLARLDEHHRRQGVPIVDAWRVGLEPAEAQSVVARELGLWLPVELEVWFAWHDGIDPGRVGRDGVWMVGTDLFPMPLSACIDEYRRWMQLAEQLERDDPVIAAFEIWNPLWFPLFSCISGDRVFIDTNVPEGAAAPVHLKYSHDAPSASQQPKVPSLTDAVAAWVRMFDEGRYRYNASTGRLDCDLEGIDPQLRRTSLV